MSRPAEWILVRNEDGTYDLEKGGRTLLSGVPLASAENRVRTRRKATDKIFIREMDGYLTVHSLPGARKR